MLKQNYHDLIVVAANYWGELLESSANCPPIFQIDKFKRELVRLLETELRTSRFVILSTDNGITGILSSALNNAEIPTGCLPAKNTICIDVEEHNIKLLNASQKIIYPKDRQLKPLKAKPSPTIIVGDIETIIGKDLIDQLKRDSAGKARN